MKLILLTAAIVVSRSAFAQTPQMPALMDSAGIPGLSVAILQNGEIASVKGFGTRSVNDAARVDEHTVFEAASLSKPVVAYIALKLVDAGRLDLDRPLTSYIRISELPAAQANRITTRMVLSHTTGLQNERIGDDQLAFAFEPGERFRYSGEGFILLQRVLESITSESLDQLARRLVFDPLGMTRSAFTWRQSFGDNAAVGHGDSMVLRRPTRPTAARAPSSLQTTAHDYARFARAIMRGHGLQARTLQQMSTAQVEVAPAIAWGLGWALETSNNNRVLWHWGDNSNSGFTAFVWIDAQTQRGLVYFANSTTGLSIVRRMLELHGFKSEAAPAFMGYEPHDAPSRRGRSLDPFPAGSAARYVAAPTVLSNFAPRFNDLLSD